jgi:hypothetical protein
MQSLSSNPLASKVFDLLDRGWGLDLAHGW